MQFNQLQLADMAPMAGLDMLFHRLPTSRLLCNVHRLHARSACPSLRYMSGSKQRPADRSDALASCHTGPGGISDGRLVFSCTPRLRSVEEACTACCRLAAPAALAAPA